MILFSIGTAGMLGTVLFGLPFIVFIVGFAVMNAGLIIEGIRNGN